MRQPTNGSQKIQTLLWIRIKCFIGQYCNSDNKDDQMMSGVNMSQQVQVRASSLLSVFSRMLFSNTLLQLMKNWLGLRAKIYRQFWLRKKLLMFRSPNILTCRIREIISSDEQKRHSMQLTLSTSLATIRHYYLANSLMSRMRLASLIWYCRMTAYSSFQSMFSAIILNTPSSVTRAIRSPRKVAHSSPVIEAECNIVVGNILQTLLPITYPPTDLSNFSCKFSLIFHSTMYPPFVVCIRYFMDQCRVRLRLESHIMMVGRKCPTTTRDFRFMTQMLQSSMRANPTSIPPKWLLGGICMSVMALVSTWKFSILEMPSLISRSLMKPSSLPMTRVRLESSKDSTSWGQLNSMVVIFPRIPATLRLQFQPRAFRKQQIVRHDPDSFSQHENTKIRQSLVSKCLTRSLSSSMTLPPSSSRRERG